MLVPCLACAVRRTTKRMVESEFETKTDGQNSFFLSPCTPFATLFQQLRQIWQLADADGDSKLSLAEFCVGMHLIVCVSKKGLPCPATRPPSLFAGSGGTLGGVAGSVQVLGGSPANPMPQSPSVRPSPVRQPPSSPPSAMLPLGAVASSSEDAFNAFRSVNIERDESMNMQVACCCVSSLCLVLGLWHSAPVRGCMVWCGSKMFSWCFGLGGFVPGAKRCDNLPPVLVLYSALAVDLPAKDPTSSVGKETEVGTSALEQGPPAVEEPLRTAQHQTTTPSRSPTSTNISDNDSPVGDSQPSAAGMQELVTASSALMSVTRDVSTAHNQVSLRSPTGM